MLSAIFNTYGIYTDTAAGQTLMEARRTELLTSIRLNAMNSTSTASDDVETLVEIISAGGADVVAEWSVVFNLPLPQRRDAHRLITRAAMHSFVSESNSDFEAQAKGSKPIPTGKGTSVTIRTLNF